MQERIRRRIRHQVDGVDVDASIDAVVAVNVGRSHSHVVATSTTDAASTDPDDADPEERSTTDE